MIKTLLDKADELPPFMVYALARKGRFSRHSLTEMVQASGLSERTFLRIARKLSWRQVKLGQIDAFCTACGVNLLSQGKYREYLRVLGRFRRPFANLSDQQLKTLNRQCQAWQQLRLGQSHRLEVESGEPGVTADSR